MEDSEKITRVNNRKNLKRKNNKKSGLFARKCEVLRNRYKKPTLLQKVRKIFSQTSKYFYLMVFVFVLATC